MSKQQHLQMKIETMREEQKPWIKTTHCYSWLRISSVVLAIALAIYADQSDKPFGYGIAFLLLLFFIVLVQKHNQIKQRLRRQSAEMQVAETLLKRMDGTWHKETGSSICPPEDVVAYDLDLLGSQSLYEYLNVCATPFGKKRLASLLTGKETDLASIQSRQAAVKELIEQEAFLWKFESGSVLFQEDSRKLKEEDLAFLIQYGADDHCVFPIWLMNVSVGMVGVTLVLLMLGVFGILPYGYAAIALLINLIVSLLMVGKSSASLAFTKDLNQILKDYDILFEAVETVSFHDPLLIQLQDQMRKGRFGLKRLNRVMNLLTIRHNLIGYIVFASLLQIDMFAHRALERWRRQDGSRLADWLEAVGELEALVSLSVMAQVKENWCFPELMDQKELEYSLIQGVHPLLPEISAVANDIHLTNGSWIITGSNMSGKTTFLRTLGITMMLVRAGAPVCAKAMKTTVLEVYTSMRVKDDVKEGISTFYAELLRIRQMMDASQKQRPMLVLIDEIFKGTNSADRILCAKTAIAKLHLPWVITLVSTHDFELCALSEDHMVKAKNYHFSEYYENDEIKFDYQLKNGRCTSTNAKELMRLAGIVGEDETIK